jgi:hypothetical protein
VRLRNNELHDGHRSGAGHARNDAAADRTRE